MRVARNPEYQLGAPTAIDGPSDPREGAVPSEPLGACAPQAGGPGCERAENPRDHASACAHGSEVDASQKAPRTLTGSAGSRLEDRELLRRALEGCDCRTERYCGIRLAGISPLDGVYLM